MDLFCVNQRFDGVKKWVLPGLVILLALGVSSCSSPIKYQERGAQASKQVSNNKKIQSNGTQCQSPYVVRSGDTLSGIAYRCKVSMRQTAKLNSLLPPYIIYVKQELQLPFEAEAAMQTEVNKVTEYDVKQDVKQDVRQLNRPGTKLENIPETKPVNSSTKKPASKVIKPKEVSAKALSHTAQAQPVAKSSTKVTSRPKGWIWPMHKGLSYRYRRDNAGLSVLEIYGVPGQNVTAVAPGKVVYAGNGIVNYGWMLVIKHDNNYMSIYAHNSSLMVREGESVMAGQKVAEMGATGNTNRPKLYLEARYQGRKIDIKKLLKQ